MNITLSVIGIHLFKFQRRKIREETVLVKGRGPYRIIRGRLTARPKKNMNKERAAALAKGDTCKDNL